MAGSLCRPRARRPDGRSGRARASAGRGAVRGAAARRGAPRSRRRARRGARARGLRRCGPRGRRAAAPRGVRSLRRRRRRRRSRRAPVLATARAPRGECLRSAAASSVSTAAARSASKRPASISRGSDLELVACRPGQKPVTADQLAEPRDVDLHGRRGGRWGPLAPERVDQLVGRDDLVRPQEQRRQEGALLAGAERDRLAVLDGFERSQKQELDHHGRLSRVDPEPSIPAFSGRLGPGPMLLPRPERSTRWHRSQPQFDHW